MRGALGLHDSLLLLLRSSGRGRLVFVGHAFRDEGLARLARQLLTVSAEGARLEFLLLSDREGGHVHQ